MDMGVRTDARLNIERQVVDGLWCLKFFKNPREWDRSHLARVRCLLIIHAGTDDPTESFAGYCAQLLYSVCERGLQQPWMPRASIFWTCCDSRAFRESHSSSPNVPWLHCQT